MVFGLFGQKKRVDVLREEVQESFKHVRRDVNKISDWIQYIDDKEKDTEKNISTLQKQIAELKDMVEELSNNPNSLGQPKNKQLSKQTQTAVQTTPHPSAVQTVVQTAVQTEELDKLTVMERAVVWALMNADMKLSYEDIATLLGKDKSTVRGQINSIKQKLPGVIHEVREHNNKKRIYIDEKMRKSVTKKAKLKVKK